MSRWINPRNDAVCQVRLTFAEVPLRNVVYSRRPRSSELLKSTVIMMARMTKAVGENGGAFHRLCENPRKRFMGGRSFPKVVRALSHKEARHRRPDCWRSI